MNAQTISKSIVGTTAAVVSGLAVSTALHSAAQRYVPTFLNSDSLYISNKEKAINTAKIVAIHVGIALASGAVAQATRNAVEMTFDVAWPADMTVHPE